MSPANNFSNVQPLREQIIRGLDAAENKTVFAMKNANNCFATDLTMYSRSYSFESMVYSAFAQSELDSTISLHPKQLDFLNKCEENRGIIFSAPTSFGKTFCVFEYIARKRPSKIVLVVPTLALVDEYNRKIIKEHSSVFSNYKVYLNFDPEKEYDLCHDYIFILTHDRVVESVQHDIFTNIDFLVIDEVYKLKKDENNDRVLVLNLAYYKLVQKARKHVLLAPFIGGIKKRNELAYDPYFFKTDFSPVINDVKEYDILDDNDRTQKAQEILNSIPSDEKLLLYVPAVTDISKLVESLEFYRESPQRNLTPIISWLESEIHEEWYLVKALKNHILVHNGQIPVGLRMYMLSLFDDTENELNRIICTATLLEGVNTDTKHILIYKAARGGKNEISFDAFDFFNLVGRSGRLFKHYIGIAHYIKGPNDPDYVKADALKEIEFLLTEGSQDVQIHTGDYLEIPEYVAFLDKLNICHEDYINNIGPKYHFDTILKLYNSFLTNYDDLCTEVITLTQDEQRGKLHLVKILHKIINKGEEHKLHAHVINKLLNKRRLKIKSIFNALRPFFNTMNIDFLINTIIRLKSSYMEHDFYSGVLIILFFLKCQSAPVEIIDFIDTKVKAHIDFLYFINSPAQKILKDMGIYEKDIIKITSIIGEDITDAFEIKELINSNIKEIRAKKLSIITRFIIDSLVH